MENGRDSEETDECGQEVLRRGVCRHGGPIEENETQDTGEDKGEQAGDEVPPTVPASAPSGWSPLRSLGPFGEKQVGDEGPEDPVEVRVEDSPEGREDRGRERCEQQKDSDATLASLW